MKAIIALLLVLALVGCAQTKTACRCSPMPTRELEAFGSFDSSTTLQDVTARVGEADFGMSISGLQTLYYHLADTNYLVIRTGGPSRIDSVRNGDTVLYDRFPRH